MPTSQASKFDEALGALRRCAEGDDEDAKKAKKMLKSYEEGAEPPKKDDEKEAKAKAEEEEKARKAKAEEDDKKKREEEEKAKALAAGVAPDTLALAAEVHAMKAERAAEKEQAEREALLAKRPDFSPEIRATLAKASLAQLKEAVEKWPRIGSPVTRPAAASQASGVRGQHEDGSSTADPDAPEDSFIARRMGAFVDGAGIRNKGRALELGTMSPSQASAWLGSDAGKRAQALITTGKE